MRDEDAVADAVRRTVQEHARIDVLVNNARSLGVRPLLSWSRPSSFAE